MPKPNAPTSAKRNPCALVRKLPKDKTPEADIAEMITEGVAGNAVTTQKWTEPIIASNKVDTTELYVAMDEAGKAVNRGDLSRLETKLVTQAVALNTMFATLAQRAYSNTTYEQYQGNLRMAFTAQGQCRATVETLAPMKNPPVLAKQANVANGPQQVNNIAQLPHGVARASLPTGEPYKLLEGAVDGERVDGGTAAETVAGGSAVEAVGTVDGPRTPAGKARVSRNAYKGGERRKYRALVRELNALLGEQRRGLLAVEW